MSDQETPAWVDGAGLIHCAKCGARSGWSWDRETGEPICTACQVAAVEALEAMLTDGVGA